MITRYIIPIASAAGGLFLTTPAALAASSSTAQSIWVNIAGAADYALVQSKFYQFDLAAADDYYDNIITSGPTVSCSGSAANCSALNQPAQPVAPVPDATQVTQNGTGVAVRDECTFVTGGTLSSKTYVQSVNASGLNGRGNFTFTWTYSITPNATVAPMTAWVLLRTAGADSVTIPISAEIAGQSVVVSSQFPNGKYSFSMRDSALVNRVTGVALAVNDGPPTSIADASLVTYENQAGARAGEAGAVDFTYFANAGSSGTAVSFLKNGDARTILNSDSFKGNNDGGAMTIGSALAKVNVPAQPMTFGPGNYRITLSGNVKGNSAYAVSQPFSVTSSITIKTEKCTSLSN